MPGIRQVNLASTEAHHISSSVLVRRLGLYYTRAHTCLYLPCELYWFVLLPKHVRYVCVTELVSMLR